MVYTFTRVTSGTNRTFLGPVAFWMAVRMSSSLKSSHGSTSYRKQTTLQGWIVVHQAMTCMHSKGEMLLSGTESGLVYHSATCIFLLRILHAYMQKVPHSQRNGYLQTFNKDCLEYVVNARSPRELSCWHLLIFSINNGLETCPNTKSPNWCLLRTYWMWHLLSNLSNKIFTT
jgi:hypothetical protein